MPRGDKSSYSNKQKRQAEHIEEGYEHRGVDKNEAERRAWATVNKETGGGKKRGSGRGAARSNVSSKRGGQDRRAARRQSLGKPACLGAIAFRQKGGRHSQAPGNEEVRSAEETRHA